MQLVVLLSAFVAFASQVTLATLPVDATQLASWQEFFDATGGATWSRCKGKRESPCTCSGTLDAVVSCTAVDGTNFINRIVLRNNNLIGASFPSEIINTIIGGSAAFTAVDLRGNTKLKNPDATCVTVPNCAGKTCRFDYPLCTVTLPPAESSSPTVKVTSAPTVKGTKSPTLNGKPAWKDFFAATGGNSWTKCSRSENDPCLCQINQPVSAPVRVVCAGTVITKISLINNNLVAAEFPADDITMLIAAGATSINLTNNPGLAPTETCFDVPACNQGGVICAFDKPVCGGVQTAAPTPEGSVTTAPFSGTAAPSATTVAPSTAAPSTVAPTTATPTTAAPTTKAPTAPTFPPGVIPPPTGSSAPTTLAPTSVTVPPTNATRAPTPRNTNGTAAPVPVGVETEAPTGSMASAINGFIVSFIVTVMAVMMM